MRRCSGRRQPTLGFRLTDVTAAAGIDFHHNSGAFGAKYLPETHGLRLRLSRLRQRRLAGHPAGQRDGLARPQAPAQHPEALPQQPQRHVHRRHRSAPDWTSRCTAWAWRWPTTTTTASPIILITAVGQNRLFQQHRAAASFVDVTEQAGLGGRSSFSTSAVWFDYDRDGLLDLLVCNYVKWSPERDVFCSVDGKRKSYCTPEAYHGETCWLFRNRGNGTFEDVTAKSGIFDSTSKSLGVALVDYDRDGWLDVLVANDTQPNKLYRNLRNGTFRRRGGARRDRLQRGRQGARRAWAIDAADYDNSGVFGIAITNFDNEMMALYRPSRAGGYIGFGDQGRRGPGLARKPGLRLRLPRYRPGWTAGPGRGQRPHRSKPSATSVATWATRSRRTCFINDGQGRFRDVAAAAGRRLCRAQGGARRWPWRFRPRRRSGPADHHQPGPGVPVPQRPDATGFHPLRIRLTGKKSNRDAIGAVVRVTTPEGTAIAHGQDRVELPVAIRADAHLRPGTARRRHAPEHRMAQRRDAGIHRRSLRRIRVRGRPTAQETGRLLSDRADSQSSRYPFWRDYCPIAARITF